MITLVFTQSLELVQVTRLSCLNTLMHVFTRVIASKSDDPSSRLLAVFASTAHVKFRVTKFYTCELE